MKKIIATIVLAGLGATASQAQLENLSVTGTFDYESQYVFRSIKKTGPSFQPGLEVGYPLLGGDLYAGIWAALPITSDRSVLFNQDSVNEVDFYIGYAYPVTDIFTVDVGFTYYWYPNMPSGALGTIPGLKSGIGQSREVYVGVSADVLLSPAVYFYYDFDYEQTVLEFSVGYSLDLAEYVGVNGLSFDLGAYFGLLNASKADPLFVKRNNGYSYGGGTADLVYAISENFAVSLGMRLSVNNDGKENFANPGSFNRGGETQFWWGASVGFAY